MRNGYGLFRMSDRHHLAHRMAFRLFKGELADGLDVMHSCDNPACVNPDHLSLGTRLENMRDAVRKGRAARGERHGRHKLTEEMARDVLAADGMQRDIAKRFGVSQTTVSQIKSGSVWAHLHLTA